ncbi:MAG: endonuclease III [Clostridiales bacterium]|nr:endonuclease III [Clostridiales bacterium]
MNKKQKKARIAQIVEALKSIYPDPKCALEYNGDPWKLLVLGRLSAQCTDARVNQIAPALFARYPTAKDMAKAELPELEAYIKSCGLYKTKAKNLKDASALLVEKYDGVLPDNIEELLLFPGVGRKIANLLLGDIFNKPAIVTDTHCIRICGRFGMYPTTEKNPYKIERILSDLIIPAEQSDFCHRIVLFGREYCMARSPRCGECPIRQLCNYYESQLKTKQTQAKKEKYESN